VKLKTIFNIVMTGTDTYPVNLSELGFGETAVVDDFDLPEAVAEQLMNLGLIPGLKVALAHSGLGNTPRIYRVDGTEFALRRGVAEGVLVRQLDASEVRS
jgi:Fe2+ transport system protein FeoA